MTTTGSAAFIGLFLPPLIAWLKAKTTNNKLANYILSLMISLIAGVVILIFDSQINKTSFASDQVFTTLGVIVAAAQTAYKVFWLPTGVADKIEKLG